MGDHSEAVLVEFDPGKVSYEQLLEVFWDSHNPREDVYRRQYRNAIFYMSEEQQRSAMKSMQRVAANARTPVTTKVEAAGEFTPAEDYHQKYYLRKSPEILQELLSAYPEKDSFVASTAAARINGYLGCNGEKDEIEEALPQLGLSAEMQARLVKYVSTNCGRLAGLTCPAPKR